MTALPGPGETVKALIEQIVSAVREGDDTGLPALLGRFAREADVRAAFALRQRLLRDLLDEPQPGCRSPRPSTR
ncbi:hypothetical protein [Streptomyces sp. NPDC056453]|uniref:hypothetical protein n=1 Tax=Streptomyces sp. NPDC056453 TaxID=3345822 RepID=UPI00367B387D